jgi:hypothetical protein
MSLPSRSLASVVLAVATVVGILGCAPEDPFVARRDGLLVMAMGDDQRTVLSLTTVDGEHTTVADVALPAPTTNWIATGRGGSLAATLADGSLHVSSPVDRGGVPTWDAVMAAGADGDPLGDPAWFPTWDPEGGRLAILQGALDGASLDSVALIDPGTAAALVLPVDQTMLASPPAWLVGDRLAVVIGSTSEPRVVVVAAADGELAPGPIGVGRIATSADGRVVATWTGDGQPVSLQPTDGWLTDQAVGTLAVIDPPTPNARLASLALDADGDRLAIAWRRDDGSTSVDVYAADDDWTTPQTERLGATPGAVVAWLR